MMELIILIILEVRANDPSPPSSTPIALPTGLNFFQLDNGHMSYIDHCIESTFRKYRKNQTFFIAKFLLECLFKDPMHPIDRLSHQS